MRTPTYTVSTLICQGTGSGTWRLNIIITCCKKHILSWDNNVQFPGFLKNCWNYAKQSLQHPAAHIVNNLQPYGGEKSRTTEGLYYSHFDHYIIPIIIISISTVLVKMFFCQWMRHKTLMYVWISTTTVQPKYFYNFWNAKIHNLWSD